MTPIEPDCPSSADPLTTGAAAEPEPTGRATDAAGWLGTALILGAYGLLSADVIPPGRTYQAMNLLGALGVSVVCWRQRAWQPLFLQIAWGLIALVALARG